MRLLCLHCGNTIYFEVDVETVLEAIVDCDNLVIENARYPDLDYTEETLRDNLNDLLEYVLKQGEPNMLFDPETETYYSRYFHCAKCGSPKVAPPIRKVPSPPPPLDEELKQNQAEYNNLRKERSIYADNLPVLWQP